MQENICPRCGSRIVIPLAGESHHLAEEEIAFIIRALEPGDVPFCHFYEKRAALLRRLNHLQSSCRMLPPETLSIIFQFACISAYALDSFDYLRRQLDISPLICFGSVCSLWRQTAWSTPALWTTFIADVRMRTVESTAALLNLCLRNAGAGAMPLHIDLRFTEEDLLPLHGFRLRPIAKLIFNQEISRNIKVLRLRDPPLPWIRSLPAGLESLQDLSIDGVAAATLNSNRVLHITLPHLPHVHRLRIKDMPHSVTISFADIVTTLELIGTSFDASIGMLIQCPNLIECHFHPHDPLERGPSEVKISSPITFPYLIHLSWPCDVRPGNEAFYRHIHFPALLRLRIICPEFDRVPNSVAALQDFLRRLPPTLTGLELERFEVNYWPLEQWLPFLPTSIEELTLLKCGFDQSILQLVQELIPKEGSAKVFPKLERLCILPIMPKACWPLIEEMVQRRAEDGLNGPFKLLLPRPKDPQLKAAADEVEALVRIRDIPFVLEYLDSPQRPSRPAPAKRLRRSWSTERLPLMQMYPT